MGHQDGFYGVNGEYGEYGRGRVMTIRRELYNLASWIWVVVVVWAGLGCDGTTNGRTLTCVFLSCILLVLCTLYNDCIHFHQPLAFARMVCGR